MISFMLRLRSGLFVSECVKAD